MTAPKKEVDVWVSADGEVLAFGHKAEGAPANIKVGPVEGQGTRKAEADLEQIAGAERLRLNPDSGELESY